MFAARALHGSFIHYVDVTEQGGVSLKLFKRVAIQEGKVERGTRLKHAGTEQDKCDENKSERIELEVVWNRNLYRVLNRLRAIAY